MGQGPFEEATRPRTPGQPGGARPRAVFGVDGKDLPGFAGPGGKWPDRRCSGRGVRQRKRRFDPSYSDSPSKAGNVCPFLTLTEH